MVELITEVQVRLIRFAYELTKKSVENMSDKPSGITWTWETIKGFGQAKILKTSYVFLFLIPVLAGMLSKLPEEIVIPIFEKKIPIVLDLPFSWFILFISACFASIGNIIYSSFCPSLIKEYLNFPSFKDHRRDGTYLLSYIRKLSFLDSSDKTLEHVRAVKLMYNDIPIHTEEVANEIDGNDTLSPRGFYFVRDSVNLALPLLRLLASISYFVAFICLGIVAIQNIGFVIMHYFF